MLRTPSPRFEDSLRRARRGALDVPRRRGAAPCARTTLAAALAIAGLGSAHAANVSWIGPNLSFWDLAANWTPALPGVADDVLLGAFNTEFRTGSVTVLSFTGTGQLRVSGGTLQNTPGVVDRQPVLFGRQSGRHRQPRGRRPLDLDRRQPVRRGQHHLRQHAEHHRCGARAAGARVDAARPARDVDARGREQRRTARGQMSEHSTTLSSPTTSWPRSTGMRRRARSTSGRTRARNEASERSRTSAPGLEVRCSSG